MFLLTATLNITNLLFVNFHETDFGFKSLVPSLEENLGNGAKQFIINIASDVLVMVIVVTFRIPFGNSFNFVQSLH